MEVLNPGWFNPTILGVLLIVLLGVFLIAKLVIGKAVTYFSDMIDQQEKTSEFLREMIKTQAAQHTAQLRAWELAVGDSTEAHVAVVASQDAHEVRSSARHEAVMEAVEGQAERSGKRHVEILKAIGAKIG